MLSLIYRDGVHLQVLGTRNPELSRPATPFDSGPVCVTVGLPSGTTRRREEGEPRGNGLLSGVCCRHTNIARRLGR